MAPESRKDWLGDSAGEGMGAGLTGRDGTITVSGLELALTVIEVWVPKEAEAEGIDVDSELTCGALVTGLWAWMSEGIAFSGVRAMTPLQNILWSK